WDLDTLPGVIPHGAASLPQPGGSEDRQQPPGLDELRAALRPPELPRPWPRGVLVAADRVADLVHAEQYPEAITLLEAFRDVAAPPAERSVLLGPGREGAGRSGAVGALARTAGAGARQPPGPAGRPPPRPPLGAAGAEGPGRRSRPSCWPWSRAWCPQTSKARDSSGLKGPSRTGRCAGCRPLSSRCRRCASRSWASQSRC